MVYPKYNWRRESEKSLSPEVDTLSKLCSLGKDMYLVTKCNFFLSLMFKTSKDLILEKTTLESAATINGENNGELFSEFRIVINWGMQALCKMKMVVKNQ